MKTLQRGFTLVELMVALLLGLILSGAAMQLFLTNQKTFSIQQAVTGLEEDGHMILRYIATDIRNAGRGNTTIGTVNSIIPAESTNGANDTITIEYLSHWDCQGTDLTLGGATPEGQQAISTYYVNDETLFCSSALSPASPGTSDGTPLISGVESFQVLYGVDREPDGELAVTNYVTAPSLETDDVVVAVRLALLLRSDDTNLAVPVTGETFQILDETVSSPADKALRRVFTTTVHIRNYNWEAI